MFQRPCENNKGLALLSNVIIIAFVGILLGGTIMLVSLYALRSSTAYLQKNQSLALNHACAEEALFQIHQQSSYSGQSNLVLNSQTCFYNVENLGGPNRRLTVSSTIGTVITKTLILLAVDASSTISINSWKEVP